MIGAGARIGYGTASGVYPHATTPPPSPPGATRLRMSGS